jgi:diguanylate cyclase (GGDEF)-like protein
MEKTMMKKVEKWILVALIIAIITIIAMTVKLFDYMMDQKQEEEVGQLSKMISHAIDNSVHAESVIESYIGDLLRERSADLLEDIKGKDAEKLTIDDLEHLKSKYQLSGVALFKDYGDDIKIEKSTSEGEIGLSTKRWGFWYTAFRELLEKGSVSLNKGYSIGNFWVGPRSLAYGQDGYYLFAYERIPNEPYLMNIYVDDRTAFGLIKETDPNVLIKNLIEESNFIDEIAVINVEAWNDRFAEEDRSHLQDFTLHYGRYTAFMPEDTYYINEAEKLDFKDQVSKTFNYRGIEKTKIYRKIDSEEVLIYVINHNERNVLKQNILYIIVGGLVFIGFISFMIIRYFTQEYSSIVEIERNRLKTAEEYRRTVEILPSMIFRIKEVKDGLKVKHCEGKALKEIGIEAKESQDQWLETVLPRDYLDVAWGSIEEALRGVSGRFEYRNGEKIYDNQVQPIWEEWDSRDKEIVIFANDITKIRESEDKAKYMAYHDSLTDLPNRHFFKETIENWLETEKNKSFAIAFIDLDGFKYVNDTAGHDIGDELLKEVASRLLLLLGKEDFAARMGGDEFAVAYPIDDSMNKLISKLEKLKIEVAKEYRIDEHMFKISASIGVSRYPRDGSDYTTLLKKADIALYNVKYAGKNDFVFFQD